MKIFVKRGKGIKKEGFIRKGGMYDFFFLTAWVKNLDMVGEQVCSTLFIHHF